jgi:hypothetical protein
VEFGGIFLAPNPYTEPLPPDLMKMPHLGALII